MTSNDVIGQLKSNHNRLFIVKKILTFEKLLLKSSLSHLKIISNNNHRETQQLANTEAPRLNIGLLVILNFKLV